ncbi:MAG: haloacid dehalogenase, partial [Nocardioidaceae bacterium]|nr:haloacid dehalogenase [Nocardioidaceae bacterium]
MSTFPRVLALDVDGTLVNAKNEMSDAVRKAVMSAKEAGAEIVISTGRSMPGVIDAAKNLGLESGIAVASNGAVVFEFDGEESTVLQTMTFDAHEVVHRLLERMPDAMVAVEEVGLGFRINQNFPKGEINGNMTVQTLEELMAEPVTRVIVRSPEHSAEEFAALVQDIGL